MTKHFKWIPVVALLLLCNYSFSLYAQSNAVLKGTVRNNKDRGIANVVVSDGYSVTKTNKKGHYEMPKNDSAKFVFISIPSNYKIPHKGKIPQFYQDIKGQTGDLKINFQLKKKKKDENFVLTVMADPQAQIKADMRRFEVEPFVDVMELKASYPPKTPFVGITAGDNLWDAPRMYPDYVKAFKQLSFPYFQVIGNHDHDQHTKNDDYQASHYFEQFFGPTFYSFNRGDCHIIALDNIVYQERTKYQERIDKQQLEWLKKDLAYVDKDKLLIISMHSPVYRVNLTPILKNADELLALLEGYKVVFISGHTHRMNFNQISDDIVEYTYSPTMGNSWAGDINTNGCPNGYGVLEFKGNRLVNQYFKATKHDKLYQFNLYPLNTVEEQKDKVVAHIWNYNPKWKIEVYENDILQGTMTQFTGTDPIAYDFFIGPEKPERKPKLEPIKTHKLFHYKPKNNKAKIKVVVTDDFGNTYTEQL